MTKLHRRILGGIVAVLLLASAGTARAQNADTVRLLLDWTPIGPHAWLYLAQSKGFFKEAGVNVSYTEAKGGNAAVQQIATDQADIGFAALTAVAAGIGNGMPIISVAGFIPGGDLCILTPKSMNVKTVKDLEGKKLGYSATSTSGVLLEPFLKAAGTDSTKITTVNVDTNAAIGIYLARNVDGLMTSLAYARPLVDDKLPSNAIMLSTVGITLPNYGLFVNTKSLPQHRAAFAKFVPVVQKTWNYIFDNHVDEAIDAMMKARESERLDRKLLHAQLLAYMSEFATPKATGKPMGWQTDEGWNAAIKTMEIANMVKPGSKPADYYTNDFIK